MAEWYDKKLLGTLVIVLVIAGLIIYAPTIAMWFAITPPGAPPPAQYLYTRDLTARFKVMDDTSGAVLTSDISPVFFSAGTNPFAYIVTASPLTVGTYDSTRAEWITVLSMGSYVQVVADVAASKTKYPVEVSVSVPGTNDTSMEVPLSPYMVHMVQRATPTVASTIYAYNSTSGAFDISVANVNVTAYSKWQVDYRFNIAGVGKLIKGGRIYLTTYTGLTIASATLDGTPTSVYTDLDSSDDGLIGNYVIYPDWAAGSHYLTVYLTKTGTPAAGTYTLKLFEYYTCLNPSLRWWTDITNNISVVT
ncbi:MAG: hypothetical protein QXX79_04670 [Candidatus Bathyarchaeia archaeon]